MPPAWLGIWKQCSTRSRTQLARNSSRTPPLQIYTTNPRCPAYGGLLRIHSHASKEQQASSSNNLPALQIRTLHQELRLKVVPPWFALAGDMPPAWLGIWKQCSTRSRTQLARNSSRTPPLQIYTTNPRCPAYGGLLRIHSHASKEQQASSSNNLPPLQIRTLHQKVRLTVVPPWFALAGDMPPAWLGIWKQCSTRSRTQLARNSSRTPPLQIYTTNPRCPAYGGLLRIHSHASKEQQASSSNNLPQLGIRTLHQEVRLKVVPPWFALAGDMPPAGPGIWKQCSTRSRTQLARNSSRTPPLQIYTTNPRCPAYGGLLRIHSHASKEQRASACDNLPPLQIRTLHQEVRLKVVPPWFALAGDMPPAGLGIWKQCSTRSRTQLARNSSRTPPLQIYTTNPRCPAYGGLLRIHSHASKEQQASSSNNLPPLQIRTLHQEVRLKVVPPWFALAGDMPPAWLGIWKQCSTRSRTQLARNSSRTPPLQIYTTNPRCPPYGGLLRIHSHASKEQQASPSNNLAQLGIRTLHQEVRLNVVPPWFSLAAGDMQPGGLGIWEQCSTRSRPQLARNSSRMPPLQIYTTNPRCPAYGGLLRIHSHASKEQQASSSNNLPQLGIRTLHQEVRLKVVPPWFALAGDMPPAGPGIWKQCSTRSRTQLARNSSRTPPLQIYTTNPRCPAYGGLLRIHSHASKEQRASASDNLPPLQIRTLHQEVRLKVMPPWFALAGDMPPAGLGIWKQCSTRSRTQLARNSSRTPPLQIYTTNPRCPAYGGLLRIHSHPSSEQSKLDPQSILY